MSDYKYLAALVKNAEVRAKEGRGMVDARLLMVETFVQVAMAAQKNGTGINGDFTAPMKETGSLIGARSEAAMAPEISAPDIRAGAKVAYLKPRHQTLER